jgi:hypothetical protein
LQGKQRIFGGLEFPEDSFLHGSLVHREREGIISEDSVPAAYFTGKEA